MKIDLTTDIISIFNKLKEINGSEHDLFLVGGSIRDILLKKDVFDLDFTTNGTIKNFNQKYPKATTYDKFGIISFKEEPFHITIAKMRKEDDYLDYRHPSKVIFVNNINDEYLRRDFTINCLYLDSTYTILDPTKFGLKDIKNRLLRLIGDKEKRVIEDPLRIIRAYRFKYSLGFEIEKETSSVIKKNLNLLINLNPDKIKEELSKISSYKDKIIQELDLNFIYNK